MDTYSKNVNGNHLDTCKAQCKAIVFSVVLSNTLGSSDVIGKYTELTLRDPKFAVL